MLRLLRSLTAFLGLALLAGNAASAFTTLSAEKPASGSAAFADNLVGQTTRLSEEAARENPALRYDLASDSPVDAEGATTTSVFWSGSEAAPGVAQSAAQGWAAANGGTALSMVGATPAEIATASGNFAAQASGNVVVFQMASGVSTTGTWAVTEFPALMANPNVTGITYNILDNSGATICTIFCPK